jgi:hypothetical protein
MIFLTARSRFRALGSSCLVVCAQLASGCAKTAADTQTQTSPGTPNLFSCETSDSSDASMSLLYWKPDGTSEEILHFNTSQGCFAPLGRPGNASLHGVA